MAGHKHLKSVSRTTRQFGLVIVGLLIDCSEVQAEIETEKNDGAKIQIVEIVKGQLISKCPFGVIVWTKIPTKNFPRFLP